MKNKNLFNRKGLKSYRSSLRNRSTSAEAVLWDILKSKNLDGRKFRRQYSIGSYIIDFCCPSEKLIIELDGDPHGEYHKIQEDENRDKYMESLGFTVLRFENRFVFQEPEFFKKELRKVINKKRSDKPINHPGRYKPLQYFDYHCTAATPPLKGGESNMNLLNFNIKIRLPLLLLPVKLFSDSLS
jgi:very-short-patch-repair endonuclease